MFLETVSIIIPWNTLIMDLCTGNYFKENILNHPPYFTSSEKIAVPSMFRVPQNPKSMYGRVKWMHSGEIEMKNGHKFLAVISELFIFQRTPFVSDHAPPHYLFPLT